MNTIKDNITAITQNIINLKTLHQLSVLPKIIAVSKFQGIPAIEQAIAAGINNFGENYVQEAIEKWHFLKNKYPHVKLHLIGHLQSNKINQALNIFDVISTIDSYTLLKKISNKISSTNALTKEFMIQINLDALSEEYMENYIKNTTTTTLLNNLHGPINQKDNIRGGILLEELEEILLNGQKLGINIIGIMAILPNNKPVNTYFKLLKHLQIKYALKELSMGMSADYKEAVMYGATMIRIGTAIFGARNPL